MKRGGKGAGLSDFQEHVMKRGGMDSYTFIRRKAALSSHVRRNPTVLIRC